ncbi:hypothetical protein V1478_018780, partial [Vespula squamosa]
MYIWASMEGSKSKKVTVASVACSCYEATGGRERSDAADGDGGGGSSDGGGSGGGGCRGGGRVGGGRGGGRGGIGGGGRRPRGGRREGKEEKKEVEDVDKYINKGRREKALENIFWRLFVRCGPVGKSSSAQQEEKPQSSLLITVRSQCEDKSKENRRVIQGSLGNSIPSASKEFVNVQEETSPVPALEFKCERICTHALTRPTTIHHSRKWSYKHSRRVEAN